MSLWQFVYVTIIREYYSISVLYELFFFRGSKKHVIHTTLSKIHLWCFTFGNKSISNVVPTCLT